MERDLGLFAHDLRAILGLARNWLESGHPDGSERALSAVTEALAVVEHGMAIADDAPLQREDVDVWALLEAEGKRFDVTVRTTGTCIVNGDPASIRRMVQNVVANAAQHGSGAVVGRIGAGWRIEDPGGVPNDTGRAHGWGMQVVRQLAERQGWTVNILPTGFEVQSGP